MKTHGMSNTPTYGSWMRAKTRCSNPNCDKYARYGGRGIKMCERWANSFAAFLEDMGKRPLGTSIERIDNDGDYCPGNCKWGTMGEQSNNRVDNRRITMQGKTKTISQWCRDYGMNISSVFHRLKRGWTPEEAFSISARERKTITKNGISMTLVQWAEKVGIPQQIVRYRISAGWSPEKTFSTPYTGRWKLNPSDCEKIARRALAGESQSKLAREYKVTQSNISRTVSKYKQRHQL